MEKLTQVVREFNKTKSENTYSTILDMIFDKYPTCLNCNGPIFYYDSYIKIRKKDVGGKSFKSKKVVNGNEYRLSVCEKCLTDKYPEYQKKNKSRVFNQMNKFTKFAYNINDIDYKKQRDSYILVTKDSMVKKYGEKEGLERWDKYREKQSYTNSFEYKTKKYGWSKGEFEYYNKSRAITLENLKEKYGEKEGLERWDKYREKQSYTKSKEYYVNKYGLEEWKKLCKSKAHTYENYIKWYGDEDVALDKIKNRHKIWKSVSKSSQKYLSEFDKYLKSKFEITTYFNDLNKEYMIITESRDIYYLDYFIEDWNIGIEYNGDLFHANPKNYSKGDTPIPNSNLTAEEIWTRDRKKRETIESERNIKIITIWESELPEYKKLIDIIHETRL